MRLIKGLQRRRLMAITLLVACAMAGGVALWYASRLPAAAASDKGSSKAEQNLQARVRKGVGSEVKFASAAAKPEQIDEAVKSTADFIYWRSGLWVSHETKEQIVAAESNVLQGKVKHITVDELTDKLTAAVADRLATITDEEIQQAAEVSANENGDVSSPANGKWGVLSKKELIQHAKSGRDSSQKGDFALRASLRSMIAEEVNDRISTLGTALPEQFGQARAEGVTPARALLIAYSVVTDDPLTDSRSDIAQMAIQKRIDSGQTRAQKRAQKGVTGRAYGPTGFLHPSASHLFFNKAAIDGVLNLSEGGKN